MISPHPSSSLFAFGTLTSPHVLRVLLGRVPKCTSPVILSNYQRHPVIGEVYPGMISQQDGETQGVLIESLSSQDWRILDYFEGDEYTRTPVSVRLSDGVIKETQAYVWSSPHSELELEKEWDFERFCEESLEWYLETTVRPYRQEMEELGITK